ncbi:hypothetical protein VHEMI07799 [[Torrubiella] hemipterigena]|uniref:Uncharacterized protein n=1 Tax=[Torrubiella] hemipterigena TaxID=1531966 RepID=A0A0A1TBG2_9HYPO|nr:hypothetical protein VHEMI07799 [[Torrubiella] hemipterigena]
MQFKLLALASSAAAAALSGQWTGFESLPDGAYSGIVHANGSTTVTSVDTGAEHFFGLESGSAAQKRSISKRDVYCNGNYLNHGDVDATYQSLQNWAGAGQTLSCSSGRTRFHGYVRGGAVSYACCNKGDTSYVFTADFVRYAFGAMDGNRGERGCPAHMASFYAEPGSDKLVGKDAAGASFCAGH